MEAEYLATFKKTVAQHEVLDNNLIIVYWITKLSQGFPAKTCKSPKPQEWQEPSCFSGVRAGWETKSRVEVKNTLTRIWMWGVRTRRRSWQGSSTPFKRQVSVTIQGDWDLMFLCTRRWAVTLQHTEGCGWVFWAWEGFYKFTLWTLCSAVMDSFPKVYLIEYNQQLKDACIKSDKMTSTHKVIVIFEN